MKKRIVYEEDPFGLEAMQFGEEVELPGLSAEEVQKNCVAPCGVKNSGVFAWNWE